MRDAEEALAETYRGYSDEYLIELAQSGQLTEIALAVARQELASRGIEIPPRTDVADTQAPEVQAPAEFVTVARFLVPLDAHILRSRLEAEGIPAMLADENLVQINNLLAIAVGGVRVLVPASFAAAAEAIILAVQRGEFMLDDDADPEAPPR